MTAECEDLHKENTMQNSPWTSMTFGSTVKTPKIEMRLDKTDVSLAQQGEEIEKHWLGST